MPFTFNGLGTMYYGHEPLEDGTYIATEWFVVCFIPVIPLQSHHVIRKGPGGGIPLIAWSRSYTTKSAPLNKKQIIRTYIVAAIIVGFLAIAIFSAK